MGLKENRFGVYDNLLKIRGTNYITPKFYCPIEGLG